MAWQRRLLMNQQRSRTTVQYNIKWQRLYKHCWRSKPVRIHSSSKQLQKYFNSFSFSFVSSLALWAEELLDILENKEKRRFAAMDMFQSDDVKRILRNKTLVMFGGSVVRGIYKDLVWLLNINSLIPFQVNFQENHTINNKVYIS